MFERLNTYLNPKRNFYLILLSVLLTAANLSYLSIFLTLLIVTADFFFKSAKIKQIIAYVMSIASLVLIGYEFRTLLNIEAGLNFIALLQACKFLATSNDRDSISHLFMLLLMVIGQVLFNQGLMSFIGAMLTVILILRQLFKINQPNLDLSVLLHSKFTYNLRTIVILSIIMIFAYLAFPRIEFSFRRINKTTGKVGFSSEVKPGEQAEISFDDSKAFKIKFDGDKPEQRNMYWVGGVLYKNNGYHWKLQKVGFSYPSKFNDKTIQYTIYQESMTSEFIINLSHPRAMPKIEKPLLEIAPSTFKLFRATTQKLSYRSESAAYAYSKELSQSELEASLKVPELIRKGRVNDLALKFQGKSQRESLENILNYFLQEKFFYTLKPGKSKSLAEFLLIKRKGFCSHYASAFAILARLLEIPSRVVTGYQGGEKNPYDDFYTVYQKDAHAWVEVFIEKEGWIRYDPVAAIHPLRVEVGGRQFFNLTEKEQRSLSADNSLFENTNILLKAKLFFDTIDNKWSQLMFSYNKNKQRELLKNLNLEWKDLFWIMNIFLVISLLVIFFILKSMRNSEIISPELKSYLLTMKKLRKRGVHKTQTDGPDSMIQKVELSEIKNKEKYIQSIKEFRKHKYE